MEVRVLTDVYMHLLSAGASTDWGMDVTWCNYASLRFGSNQTHDRACMVINNDFRKVYLHTSTTTCSIERYDSYSNDEVWGVAWSVAFEWLQFVNSHTPPFPTPLNFTLTVILTLALILTLSTRRTV
jgi:hypothetical protein